MTIKFAVRECEGCGAERLAANPCSECHRKAKAHETQPDVQRRQRVVKTFLEAPATSESTDFPLSDALLEASKVSDQIQHALASASQKDTTGDGLVPAFARLDALANQWSLPQLRPLTNRGRSLHRALILQRRGFAQFADALAAATPIEAQRLAESGQRDLDESGQVAQSLAEMIGLDFEDELPLPEFFEALANRAVQAAGSPESIVELDARLQQLSSDDPSIAGLGIQRYLFRLVFTSTFDLEQGLAIATAAEDALDGRPDVAMVMRSPEWQREHSRVSAIVSAAAHQLSEIDGGGSDLETVMLLLDLVSKCRDTAIRHFAATLLADDVSEYCLKCRSSTGGLIKQVAEQHSELRLNENLSPLLRNAGSHSDFDLDERGVVIQNLGEERVLRDDLFIDRVLAYAEVALALILALGTFAARHNIPQGNGAHVAERDQTGALRLIYTMLGYTNISLRIGGSYLFLTAKGSLSKFSHLAATTAGAFEFEQLHATIDAADGHEPHVCAADLDAYRAHTFDLRADEQSLMASFAPLMAGTTIDGETAWNSEDWQAAAFVISKPREGEALVETIRRTLAFKVVASRVNQSEAATLCAARLAELRSETTTNLVPAAFRREPASVPSQKY